MRIVSLLPSATEILFAIGAGAELVGVTHECDFPQQARSLPVLTSSALPEESDAAAIDRHVRENVHAGSSLYHLDNALLERLQPDLIVTQELCAVCAVSYEIVTRAAKRLRGDPRIVSLEPSSLEDVFANIRFLGELTAHEDGARALEARLRERVATLREDVARALADAGGVRPRLLLLEWSDPPMSGGHWTPGLIELAGAKPVLGNPGGNSQRLDWETIAREDPDVVVLAPCGFDLEKTRSAAHALESVPQWRALRAYRTREIYLVDGNAYVNRPGPRLVDTAEILATILWEDAISQPILDPHAWEPLHAD